MQGMVADGTLFSEPGADSDPVGEPRSINQPRTFNNPWEITRQAENVLRPQVSASELKARAKSAIEQMDGTNDARRQVMTNLVETPNDVNATIAQHTLISSRPALCVGVRSDDAPRHHGVAQRRRGDEPHAGPIPSAERWG